MSAREIISLLFRERIAVLIAFIIPILLAIGAYTMAQPSYSAIAKLLLGGTGKSDNKSEVSNSQGQTGVLTTKQEVVNSELEILTSRDLARVTIEEIGLSTVYPKLADRSPEAAMEVAVEAFSKALAVKPVKSSDILEVGFEASSPALAQTVLRHLIDRYQQKHIEVYSRSLSSFLDTQVAGFEHQLRQVEGEIADLKAAKSVFQVTDERRQLLDSRTTIAQTISQLRSRSAELENRLVQLRRLRKDTPEAFGSIAKANSRMPWSARARSCSISSCRTPSCRRVSRTTTARSRTSASRSSS